VIDNAWPLAPHPDAARFTPDELSHSKKISSSSHSTLARLRGHPRVHPHLAPGHLTPPPRLHSSCARPPHSTSPQSVLACHDHGVHRATVIPTPPGKGCRRPGHHIPRSVEDTTAGGPVCYKCMFQVFHRYVVSVLYECCKSILGCCTYCKCFRGMLQVFQRYVASVYSKFFINFRHMLQVFYLYVAYVSVAIHILQVSI
jgi:hypothetical protein